ncbi:hypothetical protein BLNAU_18798 [Blattamonas nauphoetae]|uniref:Serine-threonine/tyrosine-protein kinase catalytic domain-containing protein n=1 Tax=Blattamonas nauphoetae TaxID=2049346 RepID=A0ABQ9X3D9_9EUKA|nr:hypothetical protein BLNAU_18798 [Blattamonas nauphoetae]
MPRSPQLVVISASSPKTGGLPAVYCPIHTFPPTSTKISLKRTEKYPCDLCRFTHRSLQKLVSLRPSALAVQKLNPHWILLTLSGNVCFNQGEDKTGERQSQNSTTLHSHSDGHKSSQEEKKWEAPEEGTVQKAGNLDKTLVFQLGLILWEITTGQVPFNEADAVNAQRQLKMGVVPPMDTIGPNELTDLLLECLRLAPLARPSLESMESRMRECSDSDVVTISLPEDIEAESLASHIRRYQVGNEGLSWTILMEWFVEAVIGAGVLRNEYPVAPPLSIENIRIDAFSSILIDPPFSSLQSSIAGSLSSDISTLCKFFLHIIRTLAQINRLILPLNPDRKDIVFARIMVALVEHFVASGDLILQKSNDCDSSTQLLEAIRLVSNTHSLTAVRTAFFDWTEWTRMLETVEHGIESLSDPSILQSPCFRATLRSLQAKYRLKPQLPQIEEISQNESDPVWMTDGFSLLSSSGSTSTDLTFDFHSLLDHESSSTDCSSHSTISTETSFPSQQSSSDSHSLTSETSVFYPAFDVHHSRRILSAIRAIIAQPRHNSFSWTVRQLFETESGVEVEFLPAPQFVDVNEKFDSSLFDNTDDKKVVTSLRRCLAVLDATQSTDCIVDIDTFRSFLFSGLPSSNSILGCECCKLFFALSAFRPTVDDPRASQFKPLQTAFRDGNFGEKMALLTLWGRWLTFRAKHRHNMDMNESDFDFSGLLATDLSSTKLFDQACSFFGILFLNTTDLFPFRWQMDFLHQFEKKNRMMSRITGDPSPFSTRKKSQHFQSPLIIVLGSFLSVFRGCDFTYSLAGLLADRDSGFHPFSPQMNPAFFLKYPIIVTDYNHSLFPMDLMFERHFRSNPDMFFVASPDDSECSSGKAPLTSCIRLHSLLLRCPKLNLEHEALCNLIDMLLFVDNQVTTHAEMFDLFGFFPPPRLLDTLLSSPNLDRAVHRVWASCLFCIDSYCEIVAPFGACSSLAKVFKMLAPFDSTPEQEELDLLSEVGKKVVSLHWLSIPAHFDSPLLCHLPSLSDSQRGVLQTLSSHSGIPSLVTPLTNQTFLDQLSSLRSIKERLHCHVRLSSLYGRYFAAEDFTSSAVQPSIVKNLHENLMSPLPALVSVVFEFFHRFVSVSSDAVRMELVRQGLLDSFLFAMSRSSFLDDYDNGVGVIGILLATIERSHQTEASEMLWEEESTRIQNSGMLT